jgi:hypothetical protein
MLSFLNWNNDYNVWWSIIPMILFVLAAVGVIMWAITNGSGRNESTRSSPHSH